MPNELFRTAIVSRDPRYPFIITLCNYSLASLFLGMFLILSGVMLTTFTEQKQSSNQEANDKKSKELVAHVFGISLLVFGCFLIIFSFAMFIIASIAYTKTTTVAPSADELEEQENVWSHLDEMPDDRKAPRVDLPE